MPSAMNFVRCVAGGSLAGVATLFPGISGATLITAVGALPMTLEAVADVTSLRFRAHSVIVLSLITTASFMSVFLAAGFARDAFERWPQACLSLFVGLTFGGLPALLRLTPARDAMFAVGAVAGFGVAMIPLLFQGTLISVENPTTGAFFGAGFIGAAVMTMPGVSGTYVLLLIGMYLPYLGAADRVGDAFRGAGSVLPALIGIAPFLIGAVVGTGVGARVVYFFLKRYPEATIGALFGLLFGAAAGLWPFQSEDGARILPGASDAMLAVGFLVFGFGLTATIGRTAGGLSPAKEPRPTP